MSPLFDTEQTVVARLIHSGAAAYKRRATALIRIIRRVARPPFRHGSWPVRYLGASALALLTIALQSASASGAGMHYSWLFFLPLLLSTGMLLGLGPAGLLLGAHLIAGVWFVAPSHQRLAPLDADPLLPLAAGTVGLLLVMLILLGVRMHRLARRTRAAEQRLALAQGNTRVGIFDIDLLRRTICASDTLFALVGRTPDEQTRRESLPLAEWQAAFRDADIREAGRVFRRHARLGVDSYETEHDVTLPNGQVRCLLSQIHIERNDRGNPVRLRGASVDITDRKRIGALLSQTRSELTEQLADLERLHDLSSRLPELDSLPAQLHAILQTLAHFHGCDKGLVALWDAASRRLVVETHLGFADTELARLSHVPPGAGACGLAYEKAGRVVVEDTELDPCFAAYRDVARTLGFRAIHCIPLMSMRGEAIGVIAVHANRPQRPDAREMRLADMCARKAAVFIERAHAQALAQISDQRFQVALDASAVPFSIFTPIRDAAGAIIDFRWSYVNRAVTLILRRAQQELIGSSVTQMYPRFWDNSDLFAHYVAVAERGETREFELRSSKRSGEAWYHMIASPLQGAVAVWSADVTERKHQQKSLQEADRRKDEFLATLAHELRNPLAPIRQAALIAKMPQASEAQKCWSHEVIERQLQHMALLLDDLLDVSRITRGTLQLRKQRTALRMVIESAIETARPLIDTKQHRLTVLLDGPPASLEADELRLSQVLANLLMNAAKYTDPGGAILLRASCNVNQVQIEVQDDGIGIEADALSEIFRMFNQVRSNQDRSNGGLGIGLALARGLIELHGGSIEAASAGLGRGSRFTVRLPLGAALAAPAPSTALPALDSPAPRKILIADDNQDAAESLAMLLRLDGHEVAVAYDGAAALAAFSTLSPEMVLLDIGMPKMRGTEVAQAIRQLPDGSRATLIAITGWGQERDKRDAMAAGFDHHLTKPINPDDLRVLFPAKLTAPILHLHAAQL